MNSIIMTKHKQIHTPLIINYSKLHDCLHKQFRVPLYDWLALKLETIIPNDLRRYQHDITSLPVKEQLVKEFGT